MQETKGVSDEINLLELAQVLVRRRRMIAGCCLAAALASAACSLALPNVYEARATVLPPQKEGASGLSALLGQATGLGGLAAGLAGSGTSTELYLGILKSRTVADAVIGRLHLAAVFGTTTPDEARTALADAVKAQAGKDGIITVTAQARTPELAADLANSVVAELGKKSVQLNLTKAGGERAFLEKRLELVKGDLRQAEEDLKSFQERNRSIKVDSQAIASIEGIARVKAELVSREVQLASLRTSHTDESQEVKALESSIARLRSQIGSMEGVGSREAIPAVGNVPALGLEFARRMRNLKVQEAIFEQLTKQYELAKLSEAKDSSSLQVLDEAVPPERKSKPARLVIVIVSTLSAFFLSTVAAFAREFLVKLPEEDRRRWEEIKGSLLPWGGK